MNVINSLRTRAKPLLVIISVVVMLMFGGDAFQWGRGDTPNTLSLQRPSFISAVVAAGEQLSTSTIGTFLDSEAGISAYFQADGPINLTTVRSLYQTIEVENADYIIGSIPAPNYSAETQHAHVYINKNGWVLAYYPKGDPTSKMIDLSVYANNRTITTKLRNIAATVAQAAGSSFSDVTYYHFQYPNATKILVVAEVHDGGGYEFKITLPPSFAYYERSWALRGGRHGSFILDGTNLAEGANYYGSDYYASIAAEKLLPEVVHTIQTYDSVGALVLVYRVP